MPQKLWILVPIIIFITEKIFKITNFELLIVPLSIAIVSFLFIIFEVMFSKGTIGRNRFGLDPTDISLFQKLSGATVVFDTSVKEWSEVLQSHGYKLIQKKEGWVILEPLGGRENTFLRGT